MTDPSKTSRRSAHALCSALTRASAACVGSISTSVARRAQPVTVSTSPTAPGPAPRSTSARNGRGRRAIAKAASKGASTDTR
ncbi:MAG: hypothetical protein IPJ34_09470 [Myxococcales bacterium]|nr:hypothetical protein [Myxococcales bacterium]